MGWRVDTYAFQKQLQAAGFSEEQATGLTEVLIKTWPELFMVQQLKPETGSVASDSEKLTRIYAVMAMIACIAILALVLALFR